MGDVDQASRLEDDAARRRRFESVYMSSHAAAAAYARRRADHHEALDAVAATFEIVWRKLDALPTGSEVQWVISVLQRVLSNHRRATARRNRAHEQLLATEAAQAPEPPAQFLREEMLWALRDLSQAERELLVRTALDGRRNVAEALGCSNNALAIRLHRARKALAAALRDP